MFPALATSKQSHVKPTEHIHWLYVGAGVPLSIVSTQLRCRSYSYVIGAVPRAEARPIREIFEAFGYNTPTISMLNRFDDYRHRMGELQRWLRQYGQGDIELTGKLDVLLARPLEKTYWYLNEKELRALAPRLTWCVQNL